MGNPVQIISKNFIPKEVIKKLANSIQYKNQLLYSTTITTFKHSANLEKNTSTPFERLRVLKHFKKYGIPTNIMIKPFIPYITSEEKEMFVSEIKGIADFCVVGELYLPNILQFFKFKIKNL